MIFPKDPVMLLSVVNTYLRDHHSSLDDLCKSNDISKEELTKHTFITGSTGSGSPPSLTVTTTDKINLFRNKAGKASHSLSASIKHP